MSSIVLSLFIVYVYKNPEPGTQTCQNHCFIPIIPITI